MEKLELESVIPNFDDINAPKCFIPGHFDSKDKHFCENRSKRSQWSSNDEKVTGEITCKIEKLVVSS